MAIIKAPNEQYNGVSATIKFENGVGKTDDEKLISWFTTHGYLVETDVKELQQDDFIASNNAVSFDVDTINTINENVNFDNMNVEQLRLYAEEHNIELGKATSHKGILTKILSVEQKEGE